MITGIELKDFIGHRDTRLEFCRGITVFVGHNGSGKSSIIDAVTFALFGKHTRKSNRNLVRRGSSAALVQMHFTMNSREFAVTRTLSGAGSLASSQFELVSDSGRAVGKKLASGERKSLGGESMSAEIARVLGLDYDKLRIAAVVQQGELVRIVEASPKEFKELLNSLIGIDRLDAAFRTMGEVMQGFKDNLRDETGGHSYEDAARVEEAVKKAQATLAQCDLELAELARQQGELAGKMAKVEGEIERMAPVLAKVSELQRMEKLLLQHTTEKRESLAAEVSKLDRLAKMARAALGSVRDKAEVGMRLQMAASELEELQCRMVENEGQLGKLKGLAEYAGKLQIVDGRCPVCSSPVAKLNEAFVDTAHINEEIRRKTEEKSRLQVDRLELNREKSALESRNSEILAAEKFLAGNGIGSEKDVEKVEAELASNRRQLEQLPAALAPSPPTASAATAARKTPAFFDDPDLLAVDDTSRALAREIKLLREQTKGFSHRQFQDARYERESLSKKLQRISEETGKYQKAKEDAVAGIESGGRIMAQLQQAAGFAGMLERVRSHVYNRDGPIGMSLRSWALGMISAKASEYASLFNIGISRIELAEKAREISVTCYGRQGEVDMDSMSGGEKVAVALALRLGIAYMMGSNKLDFIILDEPTAHLDEERRKALVQIISEAFREGSGPLAQLIIITHDSEIFEDSEVDQVFRFAMTADGSKVSRE